MKVDVWAENFQPVALQPLNEVVQKIIAAGWEKAVIWVERLYRDSIQELSYVHGWVVWSQDGRLTQIDNADFIDDDINYALSVGRLLQPGESLHVVYNNNYFPE